MKYATMDSVRINSMKVRAQCILLTYSENEADRALVCLVRKICSFFVNRALWQHVILCRNVLLGVQLARCASYAT